MAKTKAKAAPRAKLPVLTEEQIRLGSMYYALSNLGMEDYAKGAKSAEDLRRAYSRADRDCAEASPDGAEPERKAWEKSIRRHDRYCLEKLPKECPYLFELSEAEIEKLSKALNRTWEAIASDYLALGKGKPIPRKEMLGATADYIHMYGKDPEATALLHKPGVYAMAEKAIAKIFPFERYGL